MCSQRKSLPSIPALPPTADPCWRRGSTGICLKRSSASRLRCQTKVLPPLPRPPSHKHDGSGDSGGRILAGAGRAPYRKACLVLLGEEPPFGAASPVELEVGGDGLRELNLVADGLHV